MSTPNGPMSAGSLRDILAKHLAWLRGEPAGKRANLRGADLRGTNLSDADLRGADLRGTDLSRADLSDADLSRADLSGADLSRANLSGANLSRANLSRATLPAFAIVPAVGVFTMFKKVYTSAGGEPCLARLTVPATARRVSSLVGRKCRVSRALVESITRTSNGKKVKAAVSSHDSAFKYIVGKYVKPREAFDADIRVECTSGIHGFITPDEARDH